MGDGIGGPVIRCMSGNTFQRWKKRLVFEEDQGLKE